MRSLARRRARNLRHSVWGDSHSRRRYREELLRKRRRRGKVFLVLHVVAGILYLGWLSSALNLAAWPITIPFFVAEIAALFATTLFASTIRHPRLHRSEGIAGPVEPLSLDIWICTRHEPRAVLETTVAAAMAVEYESKRVFVLDDGDSPIAKSIALANGAGYVCRGTPTDAKAGNLNHALGATRDDPRDLILTLDADQVPDADLMQRLGGYFRFASVGFVASAQKFMLPPGDPFGNADSLFYRVMQTSKDTDNAAFSCGSGVIYRRTALEQIGGFSTWSLVEDVHTSMRLHEAGWRSIYHSYPVTIGTAPADILGYSRQRFQWAVDSLRLLFWDNPFRHRGLSLAQRLQYFYIGAGYVVAGVILPFYFALPSWSLLTGVRLTTSSAATYALIRGVYLACTLVTVGVLQRPVRGLKPFRLWAGEFPVYFRAVIAALRSRTRKPTYRVTRKVLESPRLWRRLMHVWIQLAVIAVCVVGTLWGWSRHDLPIDALLVNTAWATWVIWTLTTVIHAAFQSAAPEQEQRRSIDDWRLTGSRTS